MLGSLILCFRVPIDNPVPPSVFMFMTSFCLEVMIVFLQYLVGMSSFELWGSDSVSEDTGLAVEDFRSTSARASSTDVTSISPCVCSLFGVSFGGNLTVVSYLLSVASKTQPNVTILPRDG